jgi:hypothetical protein
MTTEPPVGEPPAEEPAADEPPVVEERRSTPDRRQFERRAEDTSRYLRTAAAAALAICGGLAVLYLFFAALGAVDIEDAAAATAVAVVMALVWLGGYYVRHRAAQRAPTPGAMDQQNRERRGF